MVVEQRVVGSDLQLSRSCLTRYFAVHVERREATSGGNRCEPLLCRRLTKCPSRSASPSLLRWQHLSAQVKPHPHPLPSLS